MIQDIFQQVLGELDTILSGIDKGQVEAARQLICENKNIYIAGCGRTGLLMRAFGMRLMQAGWNISVIGDIEAPAACEDDLLIIGSLSGETGSLKAYAEKSKKIGMKLLVFTSKPESTLAGMADRIVMIPNPNKGKSKDGDILMDSDENLGRESPLPHGSIGEIGLFIFLDSLVRTVIDAKGIPYSTLIRRHANLE